MKNVTRENNQSTLIIGASSGIAKALAAQIYKNSSQKLILISRNLTDYNSFDKTRIEKIKVNNYLPETILETVNSLSIMPECPITRVFICLGILHSQSIHPEKKLEDLKVSSFEEIMMVNALTPLLWIKSLTPLLTGNHHCKITVLSARIGSISDNNLGGWYSYRASKAALNMLLKTVSIELARRAKNIKIIAFHPGTTDTELSKPFHKNVPTGKLFSCDFVAEKLLTIVENSIIDGKMSYVDWQGKNIAF